MFEVFFIKIIGFERTKKLAGVTESTVMGGPVKFKSFPTFNL